MIEQVENKTSIQFGGEKPNICVSAEIDKEKKTATVSFHELNLANIGEADFGEHVDLADVIADHEVKLVFTNKRSIVILAGLFAQLYNSLERLENEDNSTQTSKDC